MSRVEIWKSQSLWQDLPADEKRQVIQQLRDSLNVSGRNDLSEEEPYLVKKEGTDLLIWTSGSSGVKDATRFSGTNFLQYFELLSYMSVTKGMDAKKIARRLAK